MTATARPPVLVTGMSRSGTTLAQRMLALAPGVHLEVEPHMLWKSGSFGHLGDDRFECDRGAISWIRSSLLSAAGGRVLVDKSPANCLRPEFVHEVFPEARVLYLERDPVRCVESNYRKSVDRQSLNPRIVLRKYVIGSRLAAGRGDATDLTDAVDAEGGRTVIRQVRPSELPAFATFTARNLWIRNVRKAMPFGPKLSRFWTIVDGEGLLAYHARAVATAADLRGAFQDLYGERFAVFRLESLQDRPSEVERLFAASGIDVPRQTFERIAENLNPELIAASRAPGPRDAEIRDLLERHGSHTARREV